MDLESGCSRESLLADRSVEGLTVERPQLLELKSADLGDHMVTQIDW
jgi:hypothetical protein